MTEGILDPKEHWVELIQRFIHALSAAVRRESSFF